MHHFKPHLGAEYTNDPAEDGVTLVHHYNRSNRIDELPEELNAFISKGVYVVNSRLLNIKKDYLDDVFTEVFGYSLRLDPTTHRGMAVKKSTQNAIHAGHLIQCPIKPHQIDTTPRFSASGEPHYRQYQKFIDTRIAPDRIRDYRVVVMGCEPVYLFEKHIDSTCLFHVDRGKYMNTFGHKDLRNHFSEDEIDNIWRWLVRTKSDFTEIDILRDNSTGLIYITDSNPVSAGGVFKSMNNGEEAIKYLANKYKEIYL